MKKKEITFNGFTTETVRFFEELKENNYKDWFDEHKPVYEKEIVEPLKAFVTTLTPLMATIDSSFELRPHRAISRIYRDIRFSKDKTPYKTHMWLTFQIPISRDIWTDYPGYFMEIGADKYIYGMGLFMPKKKTMDVFREEVAYDAEEFRRVTQKTVLDREFTIGGDLYKRQIDNDLSEYYQQWIQRKGVYVFKEKPIGKEFFSSELANIIGEDFKQLEWLYNFMKAVASEQ